VRFHRQKQTAGDGDNFQAGRDVNVYVAGVTVEQANEIFDSRIEMLRRELTSQADSVVNERMDLLQKATFEAFNTPELLSVFANPDFQFNILEAQRSAARSGEPEDIGLIVDILVQRATSDETPRLRVATRKALDVAGLLSPRSLAGLTAVWYMVALVPAVSDIDSLLAQLDGHLAPLIDELPSDERWLNDLDLLDCLSVATGGLGSLMTVPQLIGKRMVPVFICAGFSGSFDTKKILRESDPRLEELVVPHPLESSLLVLAGRDEKNIRELATQFCGGFLSSEAELALTAVIAELGINERQLPDWENKLNREIEKYPSLRAVRDWMSGFPPLTVTSVGVVVGYANMKRVLPAVTLPRLDSIL
jgi:hypothetical protein